MKIPQHRIDLALYRMEKTRERLAAADELLKKSLFGDSIGRSYYAVFTAARAILALTGLDSKVSLWFFITQEVKGRASRENRF